MIDYKPGTWLKFGEDHVRFAYGNDWRKTHRIIGHISANDYVLPIAYYQGFLHKPIIEFYVLSFVSHADDFIPVKWRYLNWYGDRTHPPFYAIDTDEERELAVMLILSGVNLKHDTADL